MPGVDLLPLEAPDPPSRGRAGQVHAAVAGQREDVLHRMHHRVGDRRRSSAHQRPGDVVAVGGQVGTGMVALLVGGAGPPAHAGVVVMGAGVDHVVMVMVVWQKRLAGIAGESELQHRHAGEAGGLHQGFDRG